MKKPCLLTFGIFKGKDVRDEEIPLSYLKWLKTINHLEERTRIMVNRLIREANLSRFPANSRR